MGSKQHSTFRKNTSFATMVMLVITIGCLTLLELWEEAQQAVAAAPMVNTTEK